MTVLANKSKKEKKQNFLKQVQSELCKVTWTSKEELAICTKIVIGSTFVFGMGIYLVDLAIRSALNGISYLAMVITG